ncbi:unnamed protein product [Orchesella dallaii]|uniref:C2H2-type domain-containing protein n=1 Tax=Orchesella dallaii TaxID=48710 RepID=A0ABP1S2B6_9HEXA
MPAQSKEDCFPCKVCDKSFKQNYYLRRHMTIHEKRPHKCKLCQNTYKRTPDLKRHLKLHLNNIKPVETFVSKTTRTSDSTTTANVKKRKFANKRSAMGKAVAATEVSLHLVKEIQYRNADSLREFDELSKTTSRIVSESSSTVTELESSMTANLKEQPEELFSVNKSTAAAENMIIKVYVGTGESSHVSEASSSNRYQIIFEQIMDELAMAGSKTVNDDDQL